MYKMLIVEDERMEREGLADFLDWNSFNVEIAGTACDGIDGLEQAHKICPDIIITDIKMPGMDGITMSRKIKEFLPDVRIIILTGYDNFQYAKEAISFNARGYILKIMDEEEMIQIIRKVVLECEKEKSKREQEHAINGRLLENLLMSRTALFIDLLEGRTDNKVSQKQFVDFGIEAYVDDEFIAAVVKVRDAQTGKVAAENVFRDEKASEMSEILET